MSEEDPEGWFYEDVPEADPDSDYEPYKDDPWSDALRELREAE